MHIVDPGTIHMDKLPDIDIKDRRLVEAGFSRIVWAL